jgi:hypothetical protein
MGFTASLMKNTRYPKPMAIQAPPLVSSTAPKQAKRIGMRGVKNCRSVLRANAWIVLKEVQGWKAQGQGQAGQADRATTTQPSSPPTSCDTYADL